MLLRFCSLFFLRFLTERGFKNGKIKNRFRKKQKKTIIKIQNTRAIFCNQLIVFMLVLYTLRALPSRNKVYCFRGPYYDLNDDKPSNKHTSNKEKGIPRAESNEIID